ncbi:sigma-54 interaction domain-containing protein, partial [Clostridioides difficile]
MDGIVMRPIINTVNHVSKTDVSVLLLGESGTGKSSLARYIHHNSNRSNGPFITINCATISPQLLESELFGYTSGAFTGASTKGKVGLVELANGGTLFLDEIGDIPQNLQAKFLQLIQDRTFTPVGSLKNKKVDIRIISATNVDLVSKVKEKKFREDLYYRLNVIEIKLPPLRERRDNLVEIIKYYFNRYSSDFNLNKTISKEAMDAIANYRFPGNIRELQNIIQKILLTCTDNHITIDDLPN